MSREIKKLTPKKPKDLEGKDRKKKFILVGAAAAVLCAVLVVIALVGGGPAKMSAQEATTPQPQAQSEKTLEDVIVPPLSVYRKRSPFQPLRNEKSTIEVAPAAATTPPAGGGAVVAPSELTGGGPEVISKVVALEDIYEEGGSLFARVRVGDQVFEKVSAGQVFGDFYKVLALQSQSATILYGDEQFSFFEGQSIYW
ncbi:MAG: hypothetical protein PHO53_01925 [Actinomycetota bacterium]|nr:hypothetical protein [Actinomycetota bacterium]